jgi:S-adenosylmethionine:tRNA-ribosyltransferase-isomerase (queuine synthetase)
LDDTTWDCLVFPGKKLKPGKKVEFSVEKSGPVIMTAQIKDISNSGRIVEFSK